MSDGFWAAVERQCAELRTATTPQQVVDILNRYGPPSSGDAFFAGGGGDTQLIDCLLAAGWVTTWIEADYFWVMAAPDGAGLVSYIEGDVQLGDTITRARPR